MKLRKLLQQKKNCKLPRIDNILPQILTLDIGITPKLLKPISEDMCNNWKMSAEWRKGIIAKLPKQGNLTECKNWRGITLLLLPSKIFQRTILNQITDVIRKRLRKEYAGFRENCSCIDLLNTLQIILEKTFVSINRKCLWNVLCQ
jgi:sorting nexin-29